MKKLFTILLLGFGLSTLMAQNVWKDIANLDGKVFLGVSANGNIFTSFENRIYRTSDEGNTWEAMLEASGQLYGDGFCINTDGRIFILDYDSKIMFFSDDNGESWVQTTEAPLSYAKLYSPSNNIVVGWSSDRRLFWTVDSGYTWDYTVLSCVPESFQLEDVLVSSDGDVYICVYYYYDPDEASGIYHSVISDMENWTLVAFQGKAIHQMEFDPDGNIIAAEFGNPYVFQQEPGFYLVEGMANEMAIADNDVIFHLNYRWNIKDDDWCSVFLDYSFDHGEHFSQIGGRVDTIPPTGGGRDGKLYKGNDNHLYYCSQNPFTQTKIRKSIRNINEITKGFAPQGAEWYFDVSDPWSSYPSYDKFAVEGDTIIQGHQCSVIPTQIVDTGHGDEEFVYEENNKVYWFNPTTNTFSTLYDFDAEVGDTWFCDIDSCSYLVTVERIDSVMWDGQTFRTQYVTSYIDDIMAFNGKIIEGIGYEKGLFPNVYACHGETIFDYSDIGHFRCYVENGEILYHEGNYDCDEIDNHNGMEESATEAEFQIYPNPTDGLVYIETVCALSQQEYCVTNVLGQTVLTGKIYSSSQQIDVSSLPQGMYFFVIGSKTIKFVVNK